MNSNVDSNCIIEIQITKLIKKFNAKRFLKHIYKINLKNLLALNFLINSFPKSLLLQITKIMESITEII